MLNVNFTPEQTMQAQRGVERFSSTFALTLTIDGVGG